MFYQEVDISILMTVLLVKKPYFLIKYLKIKLLNPSLCMLKTLKTFLDWMVLSKKINI